MDKPMHGAVTGRTRIVARLGLEREGPALPVPRLGRVLAVVWPASAVLLGVVALAAYLTGRPVADLTREPVAALEETTCAGAECTLIGMLSNAGVVVWIAAAAASLTVAYVIRAHGSERTLAQPFQAFGAFTAVLTLDDVFQIHERLVPALATRGEPLLISAYALVLAYLLLHYRAFVLRTSFWLVGVSGVLFMASAGLDHWLPGIHLVEDGAKFVGIVTWATWLVGTGIAALDRDQRAPSAPAA